MNIFLLKSNRFFFRSVSDVAEKIGLPDWLIDIRHSATHQQKPSLFLLRKACDIALNWLFKVYNTQKQLCDSTVYKNYCEKLFAQQITVLTICEILALRCVFARCAINL